MNPFVMILQMYMKIANKCLCIISFLLTLHPKIKCMGKETQLVFDRNTVEFVTVAVEFCAFLERSEQMKRASFVDTLLKILPLLYLKASMLPKVENATEGLEHFVTEEDYEVIRMTMASIMADRDDYLEVFMADMMYSETPIKASISEDLADIYQDIKDFVSVYRIGLDETMYAALAVCEENFALYWGQKLVNTLRALHDVKYNVKEDEMADMDEMDGEV